MIESGVCEKKVFSRRDLKKKKKKKMFGQKKCNFFCVFLEEKTKLGMFDIFFVLFYISHVT